MLDFKFGALFIKDKMLFNLNTALLLVIKVGAQFIKDSILFD